MTTNKTPTAAQIKAMRRNGDSPWEILHVVVRSGVEYPDAAYMVSSALRLDAAERAAMVDGYDNNC
jgi:hypothetical protein